MRIFSRIIEAIYNFSQSADGEGSFRIVVSGCYSIYSSNCWGHFISLWLLRPEELNHSSQVTHCRVTSERKVSKFFVIWELIGVVARMQLIKASGNSSLKIKQKADDKPNFQFFCSSF